MLRNLLRTAQTAQTQEVVSGFDSSSAGAPTPETAEVQSHVQNLIIVRQIGLGND
jgi:hypothetical protein